ncbi:hypothetical protein AX15_003291 [Amanita polypyramis BW_CC]|nr:hypothetical protein AX15_003291 [Amanita polypyramis BW_CC]
MADIATAIEVNGAKVPSFAGFSDFELDLSFSPPASPPKPLSPISPQFVSQESTPRSSKTPSLFSHSHSLNDGRPVRKMSPTLMMSQSVATTVIRGSWPLVRYVGRGTPVDKTRRVEWGTLGGEEVTEDGLLLSPVRSTSLDSVSPPSQRSASPDWNFLVSSSATHPASVPPPFLRSRSRLFDQPPPELAPIPISKDSSDEWSSLMQRVLKSTSEAGEGESSKENVNEYPPNPGESGPEVEEGPVDSHPKADAREGEPEGERQGETGAGREACMTPEEIRQLDMELGNNLGLNEALNLGLSLNGGMNLFNLDIIPPDSRDSPSVYPLDDETPHGSRPPSMHALEEVLENSRTDAAVDQTSVRFGRSARTWWNKFVKRLKRVHSFVHLQHTK